MKAHYGFVVALLLLSCSTLNDGLRRGYSITEDTFDKKYYIDGIEKYQTYPNRKSVSMDEMKYFLRTEVEEKEDGIYTGNSIKIEHSYFYDIVPDLDTTYLEIDVIELEEGEVVYFGYHDYHQSLYLNSCCKAWNDLEVVIPPDYLDKIGRNKDMLVRLKDTKKRYEYILTITPEMILEQEEGLKALIKQLGLEKDDGEVNVIQQTDF